MNVDFPIFFKEVLFWSCTILLAVGIISSHFIHSRWYRRFKILRKHKQQQQIFLKTAYNQALNPILFPKADSTAVKKSHKRKHQELRNLIDANQSDTYWARSIYFEK